MKSKEDLEFIYHYLVLPDWTRSYLVGGPFIDACGEAQISEGWAGAIEDNDVHFFVQPIASCLESFISYCHENRTKYGELS